MHKVGQVFYHKDYFNFTVKITKVISGYAYQFIDPDGQVGVNSLDPDQFDKIFRPVIINYNLLWNNLNG